MSRDGKTVFQRRRKRAGTPEKPYHTGFHSFETGAASLAETRSLSDISPLKNPE